MAPYLNIGDDVTLLFKNDNDEYTEIQGTINMHLDDQLDAISYVVNDIKLAKPDYEFTIREGLYNKMINEGDDNMIEERINNKVLKLYYERRKEEIIDKYDKKEQEYFNDNKIVKEYSALINKFEEDMDKLYKTVENFDNDYIIESYESNLYKYKINAAKLSEEFEEKEI